MDKHLYDVETCLSPSVYEIICNAAVAPESSEPLSLGPSAGSVINCLNAKGIIDWNQLGAFFSDLEESSEYYMECARNLSPLFLRIQFYYRNFIYEDFISTYDDHLSWISQKLVVFRCFELLQGQSQTAATHTLLLLTALIERGLGDLVCLKVKHRPSLLKDLLNLKELSSLLSPQIVQLLRVLIGPPISLNLRNLVWHGFPTPSEMRTEFAYSVLCVIISIGNHLLENELMTAISFHQPFFSASLPKIFPDLSPSRLSYIQQAFCNSRVVLSSLRPLWTLALQLFVEKRYGECVVVLMPQFEHAMRRVYTAANDCPQRLMTAESNYLFTTFDEILNKHLNNSGENQIRKFVGDSYLILLLDFLVYPSGPRVRDRISHGEVMFFEVSEVTASHLIWLCYIIAVRFVPSCPTSTQNEFDEQIERIVNGYESLFHPLSVLKKTIFDLAQKLSQWSSLPRLDASSVKSDASVSSYHSDLTDGLNQLSSNQSDFKLICESPAMKAASAFKRFLLCSGSKHLTDAHLLDLHRILEPFSDCTSLVKEKLNEQRLNTIYRYQKASPFDQVVGNMCSPGEEELLGILSKILSAVLSSSDQICNFFNIRFNQWKNKELRSRQRNTYTRMQNGLEIISDALRLILYMVMCLIFQLDDLNCEKSFTLVKFMKKVQKYSENLKIQTGINCNKWDEAISKSLHLTAITALINEEH